MNRIEAAKQKIAEGIAIIWEVIEEDEDHCENSDDCRNCPFVDVIENVLNFPAEELSNDLGISICEGFQR